MNRGGDENVHLSPPRTWERNTFIGVGIFVLFSLLGLAYNAGMESQRLNGVAVNQAKLQVDVSALQTEWQTNQVSTNTQLARIQTTLADMEAQQALIAKQVDGK